MPTMSKKRAVKAKEHELEMINSPSDDQSKTVVHPNKFYGEPGEDIEKWLKGFERIAKGLKNVNVTFSQHFCFNMKRFGSRNLRFSDGRPICNYCKRVGHIKARCLEKNGQGPKN